MSSEKHIALLLLALAVAGCGPSRKLDRLRNDGVSASLSLDREEKIEERRIIRATHRDTLKITGDDGREILIMKAVRDDETGEMVASDVLDAAVVTARFRNVAERGGKVDLRFEVIVPQAMQDRRWQLRFYPDMFIGEDSLRLDAVVITGDEYRKAQLRGYQQYERFLASIITDSTAFVDLRNLEIFIQRNLPEVYRFKEDTTFVSDEEFRSHYGVTEQEAVDHYTWWWLRHRNDRRRDRSGEMFGRYVKSPILTEGIRLDSVVRNADGDIVYHYVQRIMTRPRLRKVDIVLSGDVWEQEKKRYTMPRSEPLTFYISSLSTFLDPTQRYLTRVVERRVDASTACYVDFASGRSDIDLSLGHNADEVGRIRGNIRELLEHTRFDLDSILIAASASPEGSRGMNDRLSSARAAAISAHFQAYIRHWQDSVRRESGFHIRMDGEQEQALTGDDFPEIPFRSRSLGENWEMLTTLVEHDSELSPADVAAYRKCLDIKDEDAREAALRETACYRHLREALYPRLRTVRFDFFLHRKGMVKDTIHTTVLDSVYLAGVEALRERDYETALKALAPYRDFNTAIAYVSLERNASAMDILSREEKTPKVRYLMAVLHARAGNDDLAVQEYLAACREDRSLVHRGNLDPEIYVLIQRYGLNNHETDLE